jgi:DsbC/DsbD-like thiol-disulfide interchange protein
MVLAMVGGVLVSPIFAAPAKDLVQATLVTDVNSIKAGQPFTAGVMMKIKPGWHTYWKNPGDSGRATTIEWKLPDGFKVGELQFPLPIRFDQPGGVSGIGYTDEVLLTAVVTPPGTLPAGAKSEISAQVTWLVCDKVCVPGNATLKLELPAGDASASAQKDVFATWKSRMPKSPADAKEVVDAVGAKAIDKTSMAFVQWSRPVTDVQWFAAPPEDAGMSDVQTKTGGGVSSMSFTLLPRPAKTAPMSFLVAYTDKDGSRQGVEFSVNVPLAR